MNWEALEDRINAVDWRVEAVDFENEGAVYVTIFSGPEAKQRALEYAAWKNAERESLRKAG
ncbi:MAG: hypothetical protein ACE14M_05090 [Terriglobales bacterium]